VLLRQVDGYAEVLDEFGRNAMHWAARRGREALFEQLALRQRALLGRKDKFGKTPEAYR
jgi:hypothetical protein